MKKKIFSIFFILILVTSLLWDIDSYACNYTAMCDGTPVLIYTSNGNGTHNISDKCDKCGFETSPYIYDEECTLQVRYLGEGMHCYYCTLCGYESPSVYCHADVPVYHSNSRAHYFYCDECLGTFGYENHIYDNDDDPDCNVCGYVRYVTEPDPDPVITPPDTFIPGSPNVGGGSSSTTTQTTTSGSTTTTTTTTTTTNEATTQTIIPPTSTSPNGSINIFSHQTIDEIYPNGLPESSQRTQFQSNSQRAQLSPELVKELLKQSRYDDSASHEDHIRERYHNGYPTTTTTTYSYETHTETEVVTEQVNEGEEVLVGYETTTSFDEVTSVDVLTSEYASASYNLKGGCINDGDHADLSGDGICDLCGMKLPMQYYSSTKLSHAFIGPVSSDATVVKALHIDDNNNGICDICGAQMKVEIRFLGIPLTAWAVVAIIIVLIVFIAYLCNRRSGMHVSD